LGNDRFGGNDRRGTPKLGKRGPKTDRRMKTFILLVTWFVYGQQPSNYQVQFDSVDACQTARHALLEEAEQMRENRAAKLNASEPAPPPAPMVSAICTPKN
jgi:hypothetical protein